MEIRWEKVVAVEHGEWSNEQQDYRAVLVFDAGGKLETDLWCSQASEKMQAIRTTDVGIFSLMASFEKRLEMAMQSMDERVVKAKDSYYENANDLLNQVRSVHRETLRQFQLVEARVGIVEKELSNRSLKKSHKK